MTPRPIIAWRGGQPRVLNSTANPWQAAPRGTAYEGATQGPRARHWFAPSSGPNRVLHGGLQSLRDRSRAGTRNNPWLWQAIDRLVTNEVGIGVTLRSAAPDNAFAAAAGALWTRFCAEIDPARVLNFGGIQAQAVRARRTAGEVFLRRRRRGPAAGLAVPLQLQVLEAEHCPINENRNLGGGRTIRGGIEYNGIGQRLAYWMYPEHPHDIQFYQAAGGLVRVPADDVVHHYLPTRPGQDRGEPDPVRALLSAQSYDGYEDAEAQRKATRAGITGFIKRDQLAGPGAGYSPLDGTRTSQEPSGAEVATVEPGTLLELGLGEDITLFGGDDTGAGYAEYATAVLTRIAAGHGVPYELMTGDYSRINDRLLRGILNQFYRQIQAAQDHLLIFQVCRTAWTWFIDAAVLAGQLDAPTYAADPAPWRAVTARPHGWEYLNPVQDVAAKADAIAAGLASRQAVVDGLPGPSVEEIDAQRKTDQDREQRLGLTSGLERPATTPRQPTEEPDPPPAAPSRGAR